VVQSQEQVLRQLESLRARLESQAGLRAALPLDDDALAALLPRIEAELPTLARNATAVIWILRSDRREALYLSPAFERIWGRSRSDVYADHRAWMDSVHPADRDRILATLQTIQQQSYDSEYRILRPDGEVRWIRDRAFPVRDEDGHIVRMAGIAVDITSLKETEARIQRQQEVLLDLASHRVPSGSPLEAIVHPISEATARCLEVARVSVWEFNKEKTAIRCLDMYVEGADGPSPEILLEKRDYPDYFEALLSERSIAANDAHTDPRTREFTEAYLVPQGIGALLDAPIRVGGELHGVLCHEHVGDAREWSATDQSFAASAADLVSLAIADHERVRLEQQYTETQKLESLGVLAGGIAHDFSNLLQGILGNADLARTQLPAHSPARERLDGVRQAARRAAELCDEMLAYSGQGKFIIEALSVHETVQEIAHLLESSISKKVELEIDISDELPLVYADRAQLRQIVMNLITNASESMGEAAGVVTIRAMARECGAQELESPYLTEPIQPGMYVILEVRDHGSGMDADTRSRMFDPFFTTKFTGRGLGLAAVLGIMRTNKGLVEVESELGQGTLVRVYFPAAEPGVQPEPPRPRRTRSAMGGTVLLVDDEEMVRIVAKAMLEVSGFDVIEASDGAEAIEVFRKNHERIDLVLLDMLMPNLGGEEALATIRTVRDDVPVLLSSGYSEMKVAKRIPKGGHVHFIKKPYDLDQLLDAVHEALTRREV